MKNNEFVENFENGTIFFAKPGALTSFYLWEPKIPESKSYCATSLNDLKKIVTARSENTRKPTNC